MVKASVIVPVYNVEKYLSKCIESILNQTFEDFELILVTDGCTDGSNAICDSYLAKDRRVRVFHNEHAGVSSARNTGIQNANGQFMFFVDSDDYLLPDYLKKLMEIPGDLVCQPYEVVDENDEIINRERFTVESLPGDTDSISSLLVAGVLGGAYLKRFSSSIIESNNIHFHEDLDFAEDTLFSLQYAVHCNTISIDDTANYRYVKYFARSTLSSSDSYDRIMMKKKAQQKMSHVLFPENKKKEHELFLELFEDTLKYRIYKSVYGRTKGFLEGWETLCKFSHDEDFVEIMKRTNDTLLPVRVQKAVCSNNRIKLFLQHFRYFLTLKYYRLVN